MGVKIVERKKLYITAIGSIFIGVCLVWVMPYIPMMAWTKDIPKGGAGGLIAFGCRWLIPVFIDRFPQLFDRITGTKPKGDNK